jgi:hypothetical protein
MHGSSPQIHLVGKKGATYSFPLNYFFGLTPGFGFVLKNHAFYMSQNRFVFEKNAE